MENEKNELPKLSIHDALSLPKTYTNWQEFKRKLKDYDVDFDMVNPDYGGNDF